MKGKFIVLYGANNLGKSTQTKLLKENLEKMNIKVKMVKYPIYDLEPTGPMINQALRGGKKISSLKLQELYAQNRRDYEKKLKKDLMNGTWIIAEDYKGTGIAWGITFGVPLKTLESINADLFPEDVAILLDGERFTSGIETGHRHESSNKWDKAREIHQMLGKRYGWQVVNANQKIEKVQQDIVSLLKNLLHA